MAAKDAADRVLGAGDGADRALGGREGADLVLGVRDGADLVMGVLDGAERVVGVRVGARRVDRVVRGVALVPGRSAPELARGEGERVAVGRAIARLRDGSRDEGRARVDEPPALAGRRAATVPRARRDGVGAAPARPAAGLSVGAAVRPPGRAVLAPARPSVGTLEGRARRPVSALARAGVRAGAAAVVVVPRRRTAVRPVAVRRLSLYPEPAPIRGEGPLSTTVVRTPSPYIARTPP